MGPTFCFDLNTGRACLRTRGLEGGLVHLDVLRSSAGETNEVVAEFDCSVEQAKNIFDGTPLQVNTADAYLLARLFESNIAVLCYVPSRQHHESSLIPSEFFKQALAAATGDLKSRRAGD